MNKIVRNVLIGVGVAGVAIAGGVYYATNHQKPVEVISVSNVSDTAYDNNSMYGNIMSGSSETYKKSDTEITEVLVTQGQEVNPGDALFRYDTTSLGIAKQEAANALTQAKLEVQKDQAELARWQTYTPYTPYVPWTVDTESLINEETMTNEGVTVTPGGNYSFNCTTSTQVVPKLLQDCVEETLTNPEVVTNISFKIYDDIGGNMALVFVWNFNSATEGAEEVLNDIRTYPGVWNLGEDLYTNSDNTVSGPDTTGFATGSSTGTAMQPEPTVPESKSYSAEEIAQNIAEIKNSIARDQITVKQKEIDYQKAEKAANDGTVTTSCKGTITTLNDLNTIANGDVFMTVTSETGFVLETAISEYDLETVTKGSALSVYSYSTGETAEATITYISETVTNSYSSSIPNTSYYTVRATLPSDVNMSVDDWVEITLPAKASDTFYIPVMYVRKEGGKSYVYKAVDGKLQKQFISTGKTLYGYEVEVKDGLSEDDYIAFPYGKNVKDGAVCDLGEDSGYEEY